MNNETYKFNRCRTYSVDEIIGNSKTSFDNALKDLKDYLEKLEKKDHSMKNKVKLEYDFVIPTFDMINFLEIEREISRENPIAYININNKKKLVMIHYFVLQKAELLNIKLPKYVSEINERWNVFELDLIDDKYPQKFKAITRWVKKVIDAEWNDMKDECKVTVTIPNL